MFGVRTNNRRRPNAQVDDANYDDNADNDDDNADNEDDNADNDDDNIDDHVDYQNDHDHDHDHHHQAGDDSCREDYLMIPGGRDAREEDEARHSHDRCIL